MTAQIPDVLFYRGEAHEIHQQPLLSFISENRVRFNCLPGATNNYRGYVVEWLISNGRLYFSDLIGGISDNGEPIGFQALFPGRTDPVFAEWFTGRLTYPQGALLGNVDTYRMIHERTIILKISRGCLVGAGELRRTKEQFNNLLEWDRIYLQDIDITESIAEKLLTAGVMAVRQVAEMPEEFLRHELSLTDEEVLTLKKTLESRGLSLGSDLDGTYYSMPSISI